MNGQLLVAFGGPVLAAVIAWALTRGYYRAAYGDRYERGYADGRAAQIRAYQAASVPLDEWRAAALTTAQQPPPFVYGSLSDGETVRVLGSWYPEAKGPPRYADLAPGQLDDGPPTSEWARDLIAGIEAWNVQHLGNGGPPWHD